MRTPSFIQRACVDSTGSELQVASFSHSTLPAIDLKPALLAAVTLGGLMTFANSAFTQGWTATSAPSMSWSAIASSADGLKLVATAGGGPIYISLDAGATWAQTSAPATSWSSVASSADGAKLVAIVAADANGTPGGIYTSADSGHTWIQTSAPSNNWSSVASSADGVKLVAAAADLFYGELLALGGIYTSADSGVTWARANAPSGSWTSVASSADGTKLAAAGGTNYASIYTSADSGATWTQTSGTGTMVACSADGIKLVTATHPARPWGPRNPAYTSTNSGATWISAGLPAYPWLTTVASSADGARLAAVADTSYDAGPIYLSTDSGGTWMSANAPALHWAALTFSADGSKLVALASSGEVYTLQLPIAPVSHISPSPRLGISFHGNSLGISGSPLRPASSCSRTSISPRRTGQTWQYHPGLTLPISTSR